MSNFGGWVPHETISWSYSDAATHRKRSIGGLGPVPLWRHGGRRSIASDAGDAGFAGKSLSDSGTLQGLGVGAWGLGLGAWVLGVGGWGLGVGVESRVEGWVAGCQKI